MKIYLVGGAVRDMLLGREPKDRDYVVVGSTPEEMLAAGFRQVGADFPVFLKNGCEYALARTERKNGNGHRAFEVNASPDVTLEQDLGRRDFTVNAMAMGEDGEIIDPLRGRADIIAGRLVAANGRAFAEDPLRVLRMARFAAQLDFRVDAVTRGMALTCVRAGELAHLTAERVWQECCRAMLTARPSTFFRVLESVGALAVILPEVSALTSAEQHPEHHPEGNAFEHTMAVLDTAAIGAAAEEDFLFILWACLLHDVGKGSPKADGIRPWAYPGHEGEGAVIARAILERLRAPVALRRFVVAAVRLHMRAHRWRELRPLTVLETLAELGSLSADGGRLLDLYLAVVDADARGRGLAADEEELRQRRLFFRNARRHVLAIQGRDLVARGVSPGNAPGQVGPRLQEERIKAIKRLNRRREEVTA